MLSRTFGALLTGPLAFFVSGVIDVLAALAWFARARISRSRQRLQPDR